MLIWQGVTPPSARLSAPSRDYEIQQADGHLNNCFQMSSLISRSHYFLFCALCRRAPGLLGFLSRLMVATYAGPRTPRKWKLGEKSRRTLNADRLVNRARTETMPRSSEEERQRCHRDPRACVCVYARETWREEELAKRVALTFLDRQRATQQAANTATVVVTFYLNITLNGSYDKQNLISLKYRYK